jgi:HEAT repeat protein
MDMTLLLLLLAQSLPTEKEADTAVQVLRGVLAGGGLEARSSAVVEALKVEHEKVIKAVGEALGSEADPVRIAAAQALAEVDHPASVEALVRGLAANERRVEVATAITTALGQLGWESGAAPLHDLVRRVGNEDARAILPGALEALGRIGAASSVEVLFELLRKLQAGKRAAWPNEGELNRSALNALAAITGGPALKKIDDWEDWWKANREALAAGAVRTYWLRKVHERIFVAASERAPADAIHVSTRISPPPAAPAARKKKKK